MEMQEIIGKAEQDIRQALKDYGVHTSQTEVLDNVSERFIRRLARDSSHAKQGLRRLFGRSPVWNEKISALVINGTRTHDPDYDRISLSPMTTGTTASCGRWIFSAARIRRRRTVR